jgi:two-component system cell cycle sensor histidine kinase/response regulator CckA
MPSPIHLLVVHPIAEEARLIAGHLGPAEWHVLTFDPAGDLQAFLSAHQCDVAVVDERALGATIAALNALALPVPAVAVCRPERRAELLAELPDEVFACVGLDELPYLGRVVRRALEWGLATSRHRAVDEELQRLRQSVDASSEVIFMTDARGVFRYINPEFTRLYGHSWDDVVGKQTPRILKSGALTSEVYDRFWADLLAGHVVRGELVNRRHDGRLVTIEGSANAVFDDHGQLLGFLAVQRDVTARKQAEQARLLTEERLRLSDQILAHVPSLVLVCDETGMVTFVSPSVRVVLGFEPGQLLGDGWWTRSRAGHAAGMAEKLWTARQAAGAAEVDEAPYDREVLGADGRARWIRFQNARGPGNTLLGVGQDITGAKLAESALRQSENRYRSLYASMSEGAALHRLVYDDQHRPIDYVVLDVNRAFEQIAGLRAVDVIGRLATEVYGQVPPPFLDVFARVADTGQPASFTTEFHALQKQLKVSAFSPGHGQFATLFEDITEHTKLEERFRQAQKMEAVGRLAGGIAHDFNNLLTAVLGYADLALNQLSDADPLKPQIQEIRNSGERAAALTGRLLAFSRKQVLQPRVIDLNVVVTGMIPMLRRVIGEDIELVTSPPGEVRFVTADPSQVEQVIMNLAVNARDAMPRGGRITVETASADLADEAALGSGAPQAGSWVTLSISDTGVGMAADTLSHLFEPFFTTKEPGKGTGLGLSTVYGIVTQSGGHISVTSELGRGTTFRIYLPKSEAGAAVPKPAARASVPRGGTETILLAEDEEAVRDLVRTILEQRGYTVLEAADGHEAIGICEDYRGEIHLLVSDVVMPLMSGPELAARLLRLRPSLRTLFLSGYTDEAVNAHGVIAGANFLQKPFKPVDLAARVRDVLDRLVN